MVKTDAHTTNKRGMKPKKASKSSHNLNMLWKNHTPRIKITKIKLKYLEAQTSESVSKCVLLLVYSSITFI